MPLNRRDSRDELLIAIEQALKSCRFANFIRGQQGFFEEGQYEEATLDVSFPGKNEWLISSFADYVNAELQKYSITDIKLTNSFTESGGNLLVHRYRFVFTERKTDPREYAERTREVLRKIPRFLKDFYHKRKR